MTIGECSKLIVANNQLYPLILYLKSCTRYLVADEHETMIYWVQDNQIILKMDIDYVIMNLCLISETTGYYSENFKKLFKGKAIWMTGSYNVNDFDEFLRQLTPGHTVKIL